MTRTETNAERERRREAGLGIEIPFRAFRVREDAKERGALWDPENKVWLCPSREVFDYVDAEILAWEGSAPAPKPGQAALPLGSPAGALQAEVNALREEVKRLVLARDSFRDAVDGARAKLSAAGFPSLDAVLAEVATLRAAKAPGTPGVAEGLAAKVAAFAAKAASDAVLVALKGSAGPADPEAEKRRLERANGTGPEFRRIELDDPAALPRHDAETELEQKQAAADAYVTRYFAEPLPPRVEAPASASAPASAPAPAKTPASKPAGLARCEKCKAPILGKHACRAATQKGGAS